LTMPSFMKKSKSFIILEVSRSYHYRLKRKVSLSRSGLNSSVKSTIKSITPRKLTKKVSAYYCGLTLYFYCSLYCSYQLRLAPPPPEEPPPPPRLPPPPFPPLDIMMRSILVSVPPKNSISRITTAMITITEMM